LGRSLLGTTGCQSVRLGSLPRIISRESQVRYREARALPNPLRPRKPVVVEVLAAASTCLFDSVVDTTTATILPPTTKMPDVDCGVAIRHFVDVQQKLNCALSRRFFELWFLSIPKSSRLTQLLPTLP